MWKKFVPKAGVARTQEKPSQCAAQDASIHKPISESGVL